MSRIIPIAFADLEIGDIFSLDSGRTNNSLLKEKTGEFTYRFIEEPQLEYGMEGYTRMIVYKRYNRKVA
jgi:hypothetical protein